VGELNKLVYLRIKTTLKTGWNKLSQRIPTYTKAVQIFAIISNTTVHVANEKTQQLKL
jgi:hypothetical protein